MQRKVLLVDDSKTFHSLFQALLDQSDCELLICNSGQEALDLISARYIDFICSSYHLRDMDGIEFCRRVRHLTKSASKPFVLLTSVDNTDALTKALPAGITDIFQKNDVQQLLAFIKRFPSSHTRIEGRLLYIEDSDSQRELLKAILESRGLIVDAFSTADEALRHFEIHDYDLVLTDIVLDGTMSGLTLVNLIRRQIGTKGDIPIIAVTAFDDKTRRVELYNLGVTDYVIKPVAEEELFVRIGSLLKMRQLAKALELKRRDDDLAAINERLINSEERLSAIFNNTVVGLVLIDELGIVQSFNRASEIMFGYARDEVIGRNVNMLMPEPYRREHDGYLARYRDTGERRILSVGRRVAGLRKDGVSFSMRLFVNAVDLGNQRHFVGIIEDISTRESLELESKRYEDIVQSSDDAIIAKTLAGIITNWNRGAERIFGYSAAEMVGQPMLKLFPADRIEDEARILKQISRGDRIDNYETARVRKDGAVIDVSATISPIRDNDGLVVGVSKIVRDITARKKADQDLRLAAAAFESQEAMVITDAQGVIQRVNQAFIDLTGYAAEEIVGQTTRLLKSGRHDDNFYREMWQSLVHKGVWHGEIWDRRKNGEVYPKSLTISAVKNEEGVVTHYIGNQHDITERKQAEEKIKELAFFDQLTGLPNRVSLQQKLAQVMELARRNDRQFALMLIDLDKFKTINDTLGHLTGDQLLVQVAERLGVSVRQSDLVARLGGDEFVIVLPDIDGPAAVAHVAQKILTEISMPYLIAGHELHTSPSIGICLYPEDAAESEELIKKADVAMYHAKACGRGNYQFFKAEIQAAAVERLALEDDLRLALANRQFVLHYQPQLSLQTGRLVGVEALIRWVHPERGMVSPLDFIPVAEESGLILPIGDWVLEEACRQLAEWRAEGIEHIRMSVNLAASQFADQRLPLRIEEILAKAGLPASDLDLEVTESMTMKSPGETATMMKVLSGQNLSLSIDDFGTGYSSLAYLKLFPISTLKIDRSFVKDIEIDQNDADICDVTVLLAHKLGLDVVAEGVETEAQLKYLHSVGCEKIQGYLISKPLPAGKAEEFIRNYLPMKGLGTIDLWSDPGDD